MFLISAGVIDGKLWKGVRVSIHCQGGGESEDLNIYLIPL